MEFKILSGKEEDKLTEQELIEYYKTLRKYAINRKLTNTTVGATTLGPILKKISNKLAVAVTKMFTDKNVDWLADSQENIPNGPVILAHSHQGVLDGFVWIPKINRHCLVLHGADVNKLLLMAQLNTGLILVKKAMPGKDSKEKQDKVKQYNEQAKLDLIKLLLEGHSISYYPETTWNLSPNKLHLPIHNGFLYIARRTGVPVVPVVHEFSYDTSTKKEHITKIHTRFGKPIYINPIDNIYEKLDEYDEQISTMRWELIKEKGIYSREDISNQEYINYLEGNYRNLKLGKLDLEKERANIYGACNDFYQFHHINDVPYNEAGELLETKEAQKIEKLCPKNRG